MKSRSHRLPILEPHHDDWGDGSWTVDCICGVNFDDGEEMVNCDECGVWVHTRCSRYVKSEKSFACDKCKNKDVGGSTRNENETEVAEFLVELPTKTLRMDTPNSLFNNPNPAAVSSRRPCRLWVPMEERVHVQGVPGGDPGLFSGTGMSSVFGPELWKATGYVPKKFNFRYNEFPCWGDDKTLEEGDKEVDRRSDEGTASQADTGAGVLFNLSKNNGNTLPTPVVDSVGVKSPDEGEGCHEILSPRHKKKLEGKYAMGSEESLKRKSSSKQPILLYSGKRKKEELGMSKDQSLKKKARTLEQEEDVNRQTDHASRSEFSPDGGSKVVTDVIHCGKDVLADKPSDGLGECATNLASNECGPEATVRNDISSNEISKERNRGGHVPGRFDHFSKARRGVATLAILDSARKTPAKEEASVNDRQSYGDTGGAGSIRVESHDKELVAADVTVTGPDAKERESGQDINTDDANSWPNKKLKAGLDVDNCGSLHVQSLPLDDVKLDTMKEIAHNSELSADLSKEDCKANLTSVIKSEASEHKVHDGSRNLVVKSDETSETNGRYKLERTVSEGSVGAKKPSGHTDSSEVAEDLLRSNCAVTSHSTALYHRKVVVSVGKSASTSTSNVPKTSTNRMAASAQKPSTDRQKELSGSCVRTMKDSSSIETVEADEKYGPSKKLLKESSRLNSESKISQATKSSSTSDSKRMSSDLKDSRIHSSSKASVVPNAIATPSESACPQKIECDIQNKATVSAVSGKGEKFYQSGSHPSSRGIAPSMNAPATTLSDEELALLLHQELNSSPRVPRVPRMRNAGSLPQLPGSTGTSMLMKRTSNSGAKDQIMTSRRKNKDFSKDGSHGPPEVDGEPKKMDRKPSSPDKRKRDSGIDPLSRREMDGGAVSMKTTNVSSSLSSSSNDANLQNLPSSRPSSRNISDDDSRMVGHLTNRTLPGLLAEIMSEGKRMTYEELCNAVLPHWPHLRKHNGERYAYSSHSQAVLDCLRNRSEWARLVDRGPKTTATRKRRKTDTDSVSFESEDNEDNKGLHAKDVGSSKSFESHQEDFPKGKRKARKGRRLALQGRGIVRRRRADVVSDDESESFSNPSEDVNSSEEEIQGGAASVTGSEASASSDEVQ